jgi:hypothetical protein
MIESATIVQTEKANTETRKDEGRETTAKETEPSDASQTLGSGPACPPPRDAHGSTGGTPGPGLVDPSKHPGTAKPGLSGSAIKLIGAALMVCDHVHQMFAAQGAPLALTMLGRPVAPIFLFMCAEGFHYTRDKKKYMLRLLAGSWFMTLASALVSRLVPSDIVLMNNIFATLFIATVYMLAIDLVRQGVAIVKTKKQNRLGQPFQTDDTPHTAATDAANQSGCANPSVCENLAVFHRRNHVHQSGCANPSVCPGVSRSKGGSWMIPFGILLALAPIVTSVLAVALIGRADALRWLVVVAMLVPNLLLTEGGVLFVLLAVIFYVFHGKKWVQIAGLALVSAFAFFAEGAGAGIQWMMVFAAIPLALYDGTRGHVGLPLPSHNRQTATAPTYPNAQPSATPTYPYAQPPAAPHMGHADVAAAKDCAHASGTFDKYFFYVFYPAHIYLLYLLAVAVGG